MNIKILVKALWHLVYNINNINLLISLYYFYYLNFNKFNINIWQYI